MAAWVGGRTFYAGRGCQYVKVRGGVRGRGDTGPAGSLAVGARGGSRFCEKDPLRKVEDLVVALGMSDDGSTFG